MSADGGGSLPVGRPSPGPGSRSLAASSTMPEFSPPVDGIDVGGELRAAEARRHPPEPSASRDAKAADPAKAGGEPTSTRTARRRARAPHGLRALATHPAWSFVVGVAIVIAGWLGMPPAVQALAGLEQEAAVLAVVEDYVAALQQHDAEAANAMVLPDESVASLAMLTDDIYDRVIVPDGATVEQPRIVGDEAFVQVVLGGELWRPVDAVRLERVDGTWRLVTGLAVPMRAAPSPIAIAEIVGQPVPADIASGERAVWLYPGSYWLMPARTPLLDDQVPYSFDVGAGASEMRITATPSIALEQSMRAHAAALVAACIAAAAPGCGDIDPGADGDVTFSSPELEGTPEGGDQVSLAFAVTLTDGASVSVHTVVVTADLGNLASPREDASVTLVAIVLGDAP